MRKGVTERVTSCIITEPIVTQAEYPRNGITIYKVFYFFNKRVVNVYSDILGKNIKQIKIEKNLNQEHLAFYAGMSVKSLSSIETGRGNPTLLTMTYIAKALDVPLSTLLEGEYHDE